MKPWAERTLAERIQIPPHLDLGELPGIQPQETISVKATLPSNILAKAIATAKRCIPNGATLPVLMCVRVDAFKDSLKISASDLDRNISITVPAAVKEQGSFLCSANRLAIGLPFDGEVSISVVSGKIILKGDNGKSELMAHPVDEWPEPMTHEDGCVIDSAPFLGVLRRAAACASTDEARQSITGARIEFADGTLEAIGTNGHCLSASRLEGITWTQGEGIIPKRVCDDLAALIPDGEVNLRLKDHRISFANDNVTYCAKLLEYNYPNWRQVIPNKKDYKGVKLERELLLSLLSEVGSLDDGGANRVEWECDGKQIRLSAHTRAGDSIERFIDVPKCHKHRIALNSKYPIQLLKTCTEDEVTVLISEGALNPFMIEARGMTAVFTTLRPNETLAQAA